MAMEKRAADEKEWDCSALVSRVREANLRGYPRSRLRPRFVGAGFLLLLT